MRYLTPFAEYKKGQHYDPFKLGGYLLVVWWTTLERTGNEATYGERGLRS